MAQGLLSNPWVNIGLGMLAASRPGASAAQAIGRGGLLGITMMQRQQEMAQRKALEERQAKEAEALNQYRQAQMAEMTRKAQAERDAQKAQQAIQARFQGGAAAPAGGGLFGPPEVSNTDPRTDDLQWVDNQMQDLKANWGQYQAANMDPYNMMLQLQDQRMQIMGDLMPKGGGKQCTDYTLGNTRFDCETHQPVASVPQEKAKGDWKDRALATYGRLSRKDPKTLTDDERVELENARFRLMQPTTRYSPSGDIVQVPGGVPEYGVATPPMPEPQASVAGEQAPAQAPQQAPQETPKVVKLTEFGLPRLKDALKRVQETRALMNTLSEQNVTFGGYKGFAKDELGGLARDVGIDVDPRIHTVRNNFRELSLQYAPEIINETRATGEERQAVSAIAEAMGLTNDEVQMYQSLQRLERIFIEMGHRVTQNQPFVVHEWEDENGIKYKAMSDGSKYRLRPER